MTAIKIQPRFIRMRDAPGYLGMCPRTFNTEARPHVREFPIGTQGIAFDREELDAFADEYAKRRAIQKPGLRIVDQQEPDDDDQQEPDTDGQQGQEAESIAIDNKNLEADDTSRIGRRREKNGGKKSWHARQSAASRNAPGASGTSTRSSEAREFAKALALTTGKKPNAT